MMKNFKFFIKTTKVGLGVGTLVRMSCVVAKEIKTFIRTQI